MKKLVFLLLMATLAFAMPKFLMPEEAFIAHATMKDGVIEAKIEIAKDIYLYEDKVTFEIKNAKGITIADIQKPKAQLHHEEMTYLSSPTFVLTLAKDATASATQDIEFVMYYQGCSEQGLCYEPLEHTFTFSVDTSKLQSASKELATLSVTKVSDAPKSGELSEVDTIAQSLKGDNILWTLLTFLGIGLLLSLTPCVFPMIPIISGVIVSQGEGLTTKRAFFLSVVYVLAMAVAYTIAGVLAGLFGSNLQAALQAPWAIYSFAAIFVALALSMFGYYELKLPDALVARVSSTGNRGGVIGVAIMGFLSALIVGPCVAAPLAGALVYIGQTGDALLGGAALFALSIGMGIPLILVGVSAGRFMPKPGVWMTMVTAIFGVMMLGVAIWMLDRVVDATVTMLLSSALLLGFALFFGVFDKEAHVFKRTLAFVSFLYAIALFVGVMAGSKSMQEPLGFLEAKGVSASVQAQKLSFEKVTSIAELDALLEKNRGKKILLDFSADWCAVCKELERVTFSDASVQAKMSEFVLIKADMTDNSEKEKALSKKYGVFGPPAILFFDTEGALVSAKTIVGFIEPEAFVTHLNTI